MQLTLYSDYSLRTLIYLNYLKEDQMATINEVADYYHISRNHLMKVVYNLSQKGYVKSTRGKNGGIKLAKPAAEINIGQVIRDMEPNLYIVECFNPEATPCALVPHCSLIPVLKEATSSFLSVLDKHTLGSVIDAMPQWKPVDYKRDGLNTQSE